MALSKALTFVKDFGKDATLRSQANEFENKEALMKNLEFNEAEFEDAINMNLVKCQTYEEAEQYQQMRMWFALF